MCIERPLDGGQEIRRRPGDGVAGDGQFPVDVVAHFGHRNAEPERRQLACGCRIGAGLQTVPELSREVDVETGEIPDWIVRQLARLPGECGDAVDVGDVDGENGHLVATESRTLRHHLGRDDVGVLIIDRPERSEVDVGVRAASSDVEPWVIVVALGRDGAVGGGVPLEDAPVIQEVDSERHQVFRSSNIRQNG
nr:hypothetical protein [Natrinema gari]